MTFARESWLRENQRLRSQFEMTTGVCMQKLRSRTEREPDASGLKHLYANPAVTCRCVPCQVWGQRSHSISHTKAGCQFLRLNGSDGVLTDER